MKAHFFLKRGITGLGFQEDLYGIGVGGLEVGRDWSKQGALPKVWAQRTRKRCFIPS